MAISDLIPWNNNNRSREMTTQRGNDVHPVLALHREMNRIFDDVFRGLDRPSFGDFRASESLSWPNIDIDETETDVRVTAELLGLGGKGRQLGNRERNAFDLR
jgi:HSP20 family protein